MPPSNIVQFILKLFKTLVILAITVLGLVAGWIFYEYHSFVNELVENGSPKTYEFPFKKESASFMVIGDSGTGDLNQRKVALQMERRCRKKRPEALLLAGDVVYPKGVKSIDDPQWQKKVFNIYRGKCLDTVPIFPVLGNHDYRGDTLAWLEMTNRNDRWNYPSRHYSIVFEELVTIYALDTQYPVRFKRQGIKNFGEISTPWSLAFGHHPFFSVSAAGGQHAGGGPRGWLLKRALCNLVDDFVAGHSHHLEVSSIEECKLKHHISGAGGGELYAILENHDAEFASSEFGFLELEYFTNLMHYRYFSIDGEIIHAGSKQKP